MTFRDKQAEKRQRNRVLKETRLAGDIAWTRYQAAETAANDAYKLRVAPYVDAFNRVKMAMDMEIAKATKEYSEAMKSAKDDYVAMTHNPLRGKPRLPLE